MYRLHIRYRARAVHSSKASRDAECASPDATSRFNASGKAVPSLKQLMTQSGSDWLSLYKGLLEHARARRVAGLRDVQNALAWPHLLTRRRRRRRMNPIKDDVERDSTEEEARGFLLVVIACRRRRLPNARAERERRARFSRGYVEVTNRVRVKRLLLVPTFPVLRLELPRQE